MMSMTLGSETGSVMNHLMAGGEQIVPEVGMGVTILMWTDRKAATILEVFRNKHGIVKEIVIQEDTVTRTDTNGMSESQQYQYTPNIDGRIHRARLLKAGWKILEYKDYDTGKNVYGSGLWIGKRCHYHDYSF